MTYHDITVPETKIADFCRRNGVRRLAFFGSILRDDFQADSDIDVLVEFEKGKRIGLQFFNLQDELATMLGRKVDLHTPGFLSPTIRERVRAEAEVQYDSAG